MLTTFAHNLRWLRTSAALTQAEVGRRVYVSARTVCDWETGHTTPAPDCLARLRGVFGDTAFLDVERHNERPLYQK